MKSRKLLYDFLKARVYRGSFSFLPNVVNDSKILPMDKVTRTFKGIEIKPIETDTERVEAENFMIRTFYNTANIPNALKLNEIANRNRDSIVHRELEMMLNSKTGIMMTDSSNGKLISVALNCIWNVSDDYDSFQVDPTEFLQIGGQLAEEFAKTEDEKCEIWRAFQYQLLFHLFHREARIKGRKFILYTAMQHVEEEYRKMRLSMVTLPTVFQNLGDDGYIGFVGTFPGFREKWSQEFEGIMTELAFVPYKDLSLNYKESNVFQPYSDKEGLTIMGSV